MPSPSAPPPFTPTRLLGGEPRGGEDPQLANQGGGVGAAGAFAGPALPPSAARSQGAGLPRLMSPACSQPRGGSLKADPPRRWLGGEAAARRPAAGRARREPRAPRPRPSARCSAPCSLASRLARLTWTINLELPPLPSLLLPLTGTERASSAVQETHCRLLGEMPPRQEGASGKKPTAGEAKFQGS